MKRPSIALDQKAILDWLLRYGDKLALAIVIATSLWLAWGGIESFRAGGTQVTEEPKAITALADRARTHIAKDKRPPAGELPRREALTAAVGPWRTPLVDRDGSGKELKRPLFPEFSKRGQPQVFVLEQVQAEAGIHVIAMKAAAGAARQPEEAAAAAGKLKPYVVVTALVPVAKQEAEYKRLFSTVGFQDPRRDVPVWGPYKIERAEEGTGAWKTVFTGTVGADPRRGRDWVDIEREEKLDRFTLGPSGKTPAYTGPLPKLAEGNWGREAVHPWVAARMQAGQQSEQPEFRMLRFFDDDDDLRPTQRYVYRVTHLLANPNFNDPGTPEGAIPAQDLEDPKAAEKPFLPPAISAESRPVTVPVPTRLLVETLRREQRPEIRNWKPGWLEIMILGPGSRGRARTLRSLVTEPGGMANVLEKLADAKNPKPENRRSKGEEIKTQQLLVDVRGSQEDKAAIQEPLELLFRRPDGGFEWVTAADSEALIARYRATLPTDEGKTDPKAAPPEQPGKPTDDPFAPKKK